MTTQNGVKYKKNKKRKTERKSYNWKTKANSEKTKASALPSAQCKTVKKNEKKNQKK